MRLFKRNGVWWYDFTISGSRERRSTGTTDKELAKDIATKREWDCRRASVHGTEVVMTFGQAVDLYTQGHKDTRFILPIYDKWRNRKIKEIKPEEIRQLARELHPKCKPSTWNRQVVSPVQAIINYAADQGYGTPIRVRRFKTQKVHRNAGSFEWIMAFLKAASSDREKDLAAMALFMFTTGTRVGNAVTLKWADVDLNKGEAFFLHTKNGDSHTAVLPSITIAALANLPQDRRKVFGYSGRWAVYKPWKKICERAGIEYLTPHEAGRHGFATEMIVRKGQDIVTTMDLGNWKSSKLLLETYSHSEKRKKAANSVFDIKLSKYKS